MIRKKSIFFLESLFIFLMGIVIFLVIFPVGSEVKFENKPGASEIAKPVLLNRLAGPSGTASPTVVSVSQKVAPPDSQRNDIFDRCWPPQIISVISFYPQQSLEAQIGGQALVEVILSDDGRALKSKLVESSGYVDLDQAAVKQVLAWQYQPAFMAGKPIASKLLIPVKFSLKNG